MLRFLPTFGAALALSSIPAYWLAIGIPIGSAPLDDPVATADFFESRRVQQRIAHGYFLIALVTASWIAGYTFRTARITSSFTVICVAGTLALVLYRSF